jgi:hypothetical protein
MARHMMCLTSTMRSFVLVCSLTAFLLGCPGSELGIVGVRTSHDAEQLVVDVDISPNTDIDGYCVRIAFWIGNDLAETTTTCTDADLDAGETATRSFRTQHDGAACTSFTIETNISLDDDDEPTMGFPLPARKSELDNGGFVDRSCP